MSFLDGIETGVSVEDFEAPQMQNEQGFFPVREERTFCLGLDVGQVSDPSAVSVVARIRTPMKPVDGDVSWIDQATLTQRLAEPVYHVLHLERLKLGTTYPAQVDYVARLLAREPLRSKGCKFALDKTSVGRPVFDLFKLRAGLKPIGITITGGSGDTEDGAGGWRVAKMNLVARLQTAFHSGTLKIASRLKEAATLANELRSFAATVGENSGNLSYGARSGQHDDLLLSVAIAVWTLHGPSGHSYSTGDIHDFIG